MEGVGAVIVQGQKSHIRHFSTFTSSVMVLSWFAGNLDVALEEIRV